jgi:hypothetical protein
MAEEGLKKWFSRNQGKGWIDCKTGKPCGRKSRTKSKRGYPACRPTMAECKKKGAKAAIKKKTSKKRVNWKKTTRKKLSGGGTVRGQGIVMPAKLR